MKNEDAIIADTFGVPDRIMQIRLLLFRQAGVVRFAVDNIDKVRSVLFQPIMFAGRDALVTDEDRAARRYTLADLAHDVRAQTSAFEWQPLRDWFPISAYSVFGNLFDNMRPESLIGSMYSDVHPDRGVFSPLLVNRRTSRQCRSRRL